MTKTEARRIVLGVTSTQSFKLLTGFPEYLASRGWEVHVVASGVPRDHVDSAVSYHAIPMRREPSPSRDLVALIRWFWLIRRIGPDIVVSGTPKAGLLGTLAAAVAGVPVRIYLLRGLRLEAEAGVRRRILWMTEWLAARASTCVQAVSPSLGRLFVELQLSPREKVVVVGAGSSNGVELPTGNENALSPDDLGLMREVPVVGFVGRIRKDKGVTTLLRAVAELRDRSAPTQVLVVGPEEPPGLLGAALAEVGLDGSAVEWVGQVADVGPYYGAMTVLCLPTEREGFPNVVLEAAVHGVPSVVADVTGARDSVCDGDTGLLFRRGDCHHLAAQLMRITEDGPFRTRLGDSARAHARQFFDRPLVWARNEEFFVRQLSATSGRCRA